MNSAERDYQERLRQSKAQGDGNSYVMGQQMPDAQSQTINNTPVEDPRKLTADADLGTSMTENATKDPEQFQTEALDRRLNMYATAASNAGYSLNDREQTGTI
jgi:hypothetical protein